MKVLIISIISITFVLASFSSSARSKHYGLKYCGQEGYFCIKIKRGDSWQRLWPDPRERDVVQRINRFNVRLRPGMTIAVPERLGELEPLDVAPFPKYIESPGEKVIYISQRQLAWGAYDEEGDLIWWGPVSTGKNYCADVRRGCRTPRGSYRMYHKRGRWCKSSKYPVGRGGAKMPYCMFFHRGYAMHGSYDVPGYRASHGCIRLFNDDAKWLNHEFIDLRGFGRAGTRVIIDPL